MLGIGASGLVDKNNDLKNCQQYCKAILLESEEKTMDKEFAKFVFNEIDEWLTDNLGLLKFDNCDTEGKSFY